MKSEGFFLRKYGKANQAFALRSFELNELKTEEVLIEVEGFGLNYAEVMARNKLYRETPPLPCVLGYEVVGKVIEVKGTVSSELVGKRVLAFCRFGAYAKHVICKENALVEVGSLELSKALALGTQYVTAFYMCAYLSPVRKNDMVLIHAAAGGVGSALIEMCKKNGAIVIAKSSSDEKCTYTEKLGADFSINYKKYDYELEVKKILNNKELDVVFNPVAGSSFKKDLRLLASGGKLFLFGGSELEGGFFSSLNFMRKMGIILPIILMMKSKSILGVNMLKIADDKPDLLQFCLQEVVKQCLEGELNPNSGKIFSPDCFVEAHELLESGKSIGKIGIRC